MSEQSNTEWLQEIYRKADAAKVHSMRLSRQAQTLLWSEVNYPKALWIWRSKQFFKFWNGTINE